MFITVYCKISSESSSKVTMRKFCTLST